VGAPGKLIIWRSLQVGARPCLLLLIFGCCCIIHARNKLGVSENPVLKVTDYYYYHHHHHHHHYQYHHQAIAEAPRRKARVFNRSLAGTAGSNSAGGMYVCLLRMWCCQIEVSATRRSPVQRSHTECGVSEYDREASIMRRPWPTRSFRAM
jgi:hypothetical protein